MAALNSQEISDSGMDYASKANNIANSVKAMEDNAGATQDLKKLRILHKRIAQIKTSTLPMLYRGIKKNADRIVSMGNDTYPVMTHSNGQFPNSPRFSKAFNEALPQLKTIGSFNSDYDYNGKILHPCVVTKEPGQSMHNYLHNKMPKDDLSDIKHPGITDKGIDLCPGEKCYDCIDCKPHQQELIHSVNGLLSTDPHTGDGMRLYHAKNLITTLNSWAAHHDNRGGNAETCTDPSYNSDDEYHKSFSTGLRLMAHKLHTSLENDYHATGGKSGGLHRDYYQGVDKNREVY